MLRAKDGSMRRGNQALVQCSAVGTLVVVTLVTTALRGLAQPPGDEAPDSIRVATATDTDSQRRAAAELKHAAASTLFKRSAFDLARVAVRSPEAIVVRLGEILKRPDLQDYARTLDESFAAFWRDAFPEAEGTPWSIREMDQIAGNFTFMIKDGSEPSNEELRQVMFGTGWLVVRWKQPAAEPWATLLLIPGVEQKLYGDTPYVELPLIPAIGPSRMCVCQVDEHSLLLAQSDTNLATRLDKLKETAEPAAWRGAWEEVEGGLIAMIATDRSFVRSMISPMDEQEKLTRDLYSAKRYAVGMDWQPQAGGTAVIKMHFGFDSQEQAGTFCKAVDAAVERIANDWSKAREAADEKLLMLAKLGLDPLRNAKIQTRAVEDGWQVDIQIAGPLKAPTNLMR